MEFERVAFGFCVGVTTACVLITVAVHVKRDVRSVIMGLLLGTALIALAFALTNHEPNVCVPQERRS